MALDKRDVAGAQAYQTASLTSDGDDGRWWTPEHIELAAAPARRVAPPRFDVTTASFEFPSALVEARAQTLVEGARRDGEPHNLSLWRGALRSALEQISREAAHAPARATCAALFWDHVGEQYRVAVTFEIPPLASRSARVH
ncbi:MAG TPA: hypothetical protein VHI51_07800 [Ktedonobacterales bacterium]|nr:hypothetical protein [Ktedonobacterales bacterium]